MATPNILLPTQLQTMASSFFSAYASLAASTMLVRSVTNDIVPSSIRIYIESAIRYLLDKRLPPTITIVVEESAGYTRNQAYESVETYLRNRISTSTKRFKVNKTPKQAKINVAVDREFEVTDKYQDFQVEWKFVVAQKNEKGRSSEKDVYELSFDEKLKDRVLEDYLPFIVAKAQEMKVNNRFVKLYTRDIQSSDDDDDDCGRRRHSRGHWGSINMEHPFTFDSLAMDPDMKQAIIEDLERFVRRRDYYKKVGKAWKRGYLLYGPPGTGKSSIIAAMANYLKFDIYDLELTSLYSNSELRNVLLSTTNRSIIVIEDIDCSKQTKNRDDEDYQPKSFSRGLTLSGLLNFIDGLWSSCADERIIVFTTNYKDRLDPALLRPGRMDMHILMSYCTYQGFKVLAKNYLALEDHTVFGEIEEIIAKVQVSPAQLAEEMMRSEDVDVALQGVLDFLKNKEKEQSEVPNPSPPKKDKTSYKDDDNIDGLVTHNGHGSRGRGRGGRGHRGRR